MNQELIYCIRFDMKFDAYQIRKVDILIQNNGDLIDLLPPTSLCRLNEVTINNIENSYHFKCYVKSLDVISAFLSGFNLIKSCLTKNNFL